MYRPSAAYPKMTRFLHLNWSHAIPRQPSVHEGMGSSHFYPMQDFSVGSICTIAPYWAGQKVPRAVSVWGSHPGPTRVSCILLHLRFPLPFSVRPAERAKALPAYSVLPALLFFTGLTTNNLSCSSNSAWFLLLREPTNTTGTRNDQKEEAVR